jgi:hypothetical protein
MHAKARHVSVSGLAALGTLMAGEAVKALRSAIDQSTQPLPGAR